MKWVYLSPHLDDAALSCGGLIWLQTQAGQQVSIWTVCAGDPPPGLLSEYAQRHHTRWRLSQDATAIRREEDARSCRILGAVWQHFSVPDAIYRRHSAEEAHLYTSERALFGRLDRSEGVLVDWLAGQISRQVSVDDYLIAPLALGSHVDHQLTRLAVELLENPIQYYADYPYAEEYRGEINDLLPEGYRQKIYPIPEAALNIWKRSVSSHESQISTFWEDEAAMGAALHEYCDANGGIRLWEPSE